MNYQFVVIIPFDGNAKGAIIDNCPPEKRGLCNKIAVPEKQTKAEAKK